MAEIVLVDTSIFSNIINIPGYNQHKEEVYQELRTLASDSTITLLLPMAAILETGNHVARLPSGSLRRERAGYFVEAVRGALDGRAPWQACQFWSVASLRDWLSEFPDHACHGRGIADCSIVKDWERTCDLHSGRRVRIWSL